MPTGSLKKIWRRTSGANCALWRKVLIPIARHHPVEPSARATSSITCSVVTMSAPRPPSASGSATLNNRALAMSMTRSAGSFRAASISAARFRILGASPRATSNGVVAADTVSVIMVFGGPRAPAGPGQSCPAAGTPSRSLCHEVDVQNHLVLVLDGAQQGAIGRVAEAALLELQLGAPPELGALHAHLGWKRELVRDGADREAAGDQKTAIGLRRDRGRRKGHRRESCGGELPFALHRFVDLSSITRGGLPGQPELAARVRVVRDQRPDFDRHLDRRRFRITRIVRDGARKHAGVDHVVVAEPRRHAVFEELQDEPW